MMSHAARVRRRVADQALQLALIAGFVLILVPTSLYLGPALEQRALPVLDAKIKLMGEQGGRLVFYVEGWKLRPCQLISVSFAWRYDHSVMPTGAALGNGDVARGQTIGIVAANEQFLVGPFYAVVPTAVRLAPEPTLSVTYYYRCHLLWEVEQQLTAAVALAPPPPPAQLGGTP